MNTLLRGLRLTAYDIRHSVPLSISLVIVCLAFIFTILVIVGLK